MEVPISVGSLGSAVAFAMCISAACFCAKRYRRMAAIQMQQQQQQAYPVYTSYAIPVSPLNPPISYTPQVPPLNPPISYAPQVPPPSPPISYTLQAPHPPPINPYAFEYDPHPSYTTVTYAAQGVQAPQKMGVGGAGYYAPNANMHTPTI